MIWGAAWWPKAWKAPMMPTGWLRWVANSARAFISLRRSAPLTRWPSLPAITTWQRQRLLSLRISTFSIRSSNNDDQGGRPDPLGDSDANAGRRAQAGFDGRIVQGQESGAVRAAGRLYAHLLGQASARLHSAARR